jgi:hypothetical protein
MVSPILIILCLPRTIPVAFNPGVGYTVFWRRLVLVLAGLTAAWLIDLVPRPKTGRADLRNTYSKTTFAIGSITATVLARMKDAPMQQRKNRSLIDRIGPQILSVHNKIRLSSVRISLAKLEPSIHRKWSEEHYLTLQRLQFEMLDLLGILAIVSEDMDVEAMSKLLASPLFQSHQVRWNLERPSLTNMSLVAGHVAPQSLLCCIVLITVSTTTAVPAPNPSRCNCYVRGPGSPAIVDSGRRSHEAIYHPWRRVH